MNTPTNGTPTDYRTRLREAKQRRAVARAEYEARLFESFLALDDFSLGYGGSADSWRRLRDEDGTIWGPVGSKSDRAHGRNWPLWRDTSELGRLRQAARMTCRSNAYARGLLRGLVDYTIYTGFRYQAVSKENTPDADPDKRGHQDSEAVDRLVAKVQDVVDGFVRHNNWNQRERQVWRRVLRDGEAFVRLYRTDDGRVTTRWIEPEQVMDPPGAQIADGWMHGIKHQVEPFEDVETVEEYHVLYQDLQTATDLDTPTGEYVDANDVVHIKNPEEDDTIARGAPWFSYDTISALEWASKTTRNSVIGSAIRAATAEYHEHTGHTQTQVASFAQALADRRVVDTVKGDYKDVELVRPGAIRRVPEGQKWVAPPASTGVGEHSQSVQGALRMAATAAQAPEHIASGDASNNNYASIKEAGTPFVRSTEADQEYLSTHFRRIVWGAVEWAVETGDLPREVLKLVELQIEPPKVSQRDPLQVAQENYMYHGMQVKSAKTVQMELGLDPEIEAENFSGEQQAQAEQQQQQAGAGGTRAPAAAGGAGSPLDSLKRQMTSGGLSESTIAEEEDPQERAEALADILLGLYGDDALEMLDQIDGKNVSESVRLFEAWDAGKHPKGPDGRFIKKNSPEAVAAAHDAIATALKDKRSPESASALMNHLNILSVAQLHELRQKYGLSASGRNRDELVQKLADRLDRGRRDDAPQATGEEPSYAEWAAGEREKNRAKGQQQEQPAAREPAAPLAPVPFAGDPARHAGDAWDRAATLTPDELEQFYVGVDGMTKSQLLKAAQATGMVGGGTMGRQQLATELKNRVKEAHGTARRSRLTGRSGQGGAVEDRPLRGDPANDPQPQRKPAARPAPTPSREETQPPALSPAAQAAHDEARQLWQGAGGMSEAALAAAHQRIDSMSGEELLGAARAMDFKSTAGSRAKLAASLKDRLTALRNSAIRSRLTGRSGQGEGGTEPAAPQQSGGWDRAAVEDAMVRGKPIPPEVLDQHPDLKAKIEQATPAPTPAAPRLSHEETKQTILDHAADLAKGVYARSNGFMPVQSLRQSIAAALGDGVSREQIDQALQSLWLDKKIRLVAGESGLSDEQKQGAVVDRFGERLPNVELTKEGTNAAKPLKREPLDAATAKGVEDEILSHVGTAGTPGRPYVNIPDIRAAVREKYGDNAASHAHFNAAMNRLRQSGQLRVRAISNLGDASRQQLQDALPGVGETLYYAEPGENHPGKTPQQSGGVNYRPAARAADAGDVPVEVDLAKLDQHWAKDQGYHIPPGGGGDKTKYRQAGEYLDSGKPVDMPQVTFDQNGLSFVDGRHRAAAARDGGKGSMYVTVPADQADALRAAMGTGGGGSPPDSGTPTAASGGEGGNVPQALADALAPKVASNPARWSAVSDTINSMPADELARVGEYIGGNKNRASKVLDRLQAGKPWSGTSNEDAAAEQERQRSEQARQRSQTEQEQWNAQNAEADRRAAERLAAAKAAPPKPEPTLTDIARENPRKVGLPRQAIDQLPQDGRVLSVRQEGVGAGYDDPVKPGDVVRQDGQDWYVMHASDVQSVRFHPDAPAMRRQHVTARPATPQEAERHRDLTRAAALERHLSGPFTDMSPEQVASYRERTKQEIAALRGKHAVPAPQQSGGNSVDAVPNREYTPSGGSDVPAPTTGSQPEGREMDTMTPVKRFNRQPVKDGSPGDRMKLTLSVPYSKKTNEALKGAGWKWDQHARLWRHDVSPGLADRIRNGGEDKMAALRELAAVDSSAKISNSFGIPIFLGAKHAEAPNEAEAGRPAASANKVWRHADKAGALKAGSMIKAKDGSLQVVTSVGKPRYDESTMRYSHDYETRPATAEEHGRHVVDTLKVKAAAARSLMADDDRHTAETSGLAKHAGALQRVEAAIAAGQPIPPEVLAAYPDLAAQPSTSAPQPPR